MSIDITGNPFLLESTLTHKAPEFDKIKIEHFEPAIRHGMAIQLDEIKSIVNNTDTPTFENTFEKLESSGRLLTRARSVFDNLSMSDSTEEMRALEDIITPLITQHWDNILLDDGLFQRITSIYNQRNTLKHLDNEQIRLIEHWYQQFTRSGANLSNDNKNILRTLNNDISTLINKFQQNLIKLDNITGITITDINDLDGLSQDEINTARDAAIERKLDNGNDNIWFLGVTNTTRQPLFTSLKKQSIRKLLYNASITRGLDGDVSNVELVEKILKLRAKKAKLLGYPNWASFVLEEQMAKTPEKAIDMLQSMCSRVVDNVHKEERAIKRVIWRQQYKDLHCKDDNNTTIPEPNDNDLSTIIVEPWDWEHYSAYVLSEEYDYNESDLKPYCEFTTVLEKCLFYVMNNLYGLTFKQRNDLPLYHPDVLTYEMYTDNGQSESIFYGDYFKRTGKSGGAWFTPFITQSTYLDQIPVGVNVMNIHKSTSNDIPTFVPFQDISTILHEYGHYRHSISKCKYETLAGTNTAVDFVEFPSTVHEDWVFHPDILSNFAIHYKTGQHIPHELVDKVVKARTFNQGYDTLEYIAAALIDISWHMLDEDGLDAVFKCNNPIPTFERSILDKYNIYVHSVPPRYLTQYFSHIFAGYSALYYAYMWSEILAADAHEYMVLNGGATRQNGDKFMKCILDMGNSRDPMISYIEFRGQEPTTDALLRRRGLLPPLDMAKIATATTTATADIAATAPPTTDAVEVKKDDNVTDVVHNDEKVIA